MPRQLPWLQGASSSGGQKNVAKTTTPARKRPRFNEGNSHGNNIDTDNPANHGKSKTTRTPSTSPPPEPPVEKFMVEGVERDDKYRMVEDEFLTIAKQFTAHLHAAEYHRQKGLARTKNAEKSSSISRPVTQKMPEQTKRKLESVNRSKVQRNALQSLLGKQDTKADYQDDSDTGDALPYVGTTLHGLMDSPRRRAASLTKFGSTARTTRAAAGFQRPTIGSSQSNRSPPPKNSHQRSVIGNLTLHSPTESSDDDDDLDGPLPAPKFVPISKTASKHKDFPLTSTQTSKIPHCIQSSKSRSLESIKKQSCAPANVKREDSDDELPSHRPNIDRIAAIRKRRERAILEKAKQEKKENSKNESVVIPTFL